MIVDFVSTVAKHIEHWNSFVHVDEGGNATGAGRKTARRNRRLRNGGMREAECDINRVSFTLIGEAERIGTE